ncbi:MAG TPA: GNAT family N-acetyltransferase [Bryobacteraceae bacterium]|nr:GNAT family N-acetyltransferase [Bryobacteraceae bacterium]
MTTPEPAGRHSLILRRATQEDLDRIRPLWHALYQHQLEHGMLLRLPEGAYDAWLKSIVPFLGRFANVVVAELNHEIVAFVAGRIRTLPPYFGSSTIGAISEVFVSESHRSAGIGRRLLAFALEWFKAQQIERVELQVVAGNPEAIRFYRQLGWHEELLQMVWDTSR